MTESNIDPFEIDKFSRVAQEWWDLKGPMRGLHDINPARTDYICRRMDVNGKTILDIGCGGGILSESLAARGAKVTGIDLNATALKIARLHGEKSGLNIDYRLTSAERLAMENPESFDLVACMEVLEHVPDPGSMVKACKSAVKPGGEVFFATINRTPAAWLLAIAAAERILRIVAGGTHSYSRFIKPEELADWAKKCGLVQKDLSGILYIPFGPICRITRHTPVNYMMHFSSPEISG